MMLAPRSNSNVCVRYMYLPMPMERPSHFNNIVMRQEKFQVMWHSVRPEKYIRILPAGSAPAC